MTDKNSYKELFNKKDDLTLEDEIEAWIEDHEEMGLKNILFKALGYNHHLIIKIPNMILSDTFNIVSKTFKNPYIYQNELIVIENTDTNLKQKISLNISKNKDVNYKETYENIENFTEQTKENKPSTFYCNIRYEEAKNILFYINFLKPLSLKIN